MLFVDLWQSPILGFTHYETCLIIHFILMHKKLDEKKELLNKLLINYPDIDYSIQNQIDNIIMLQLPNIYKKYI